MNLFSKVINIFKKSLDKIDFYIYEYKNLLDIFNIQKGLHLGITSSKKTLFLYNQKTGDSEILRVKKDTDALEKIYNSLANYPVDGNKRIAKIDENKLLSIFKENLNEASYEDFIESYKKTFKKGVKHNIWEKIFF